MKVEDLMKKQKGKLVTCRTRDTVQTSAQIMADREIGILPVLDDDGTMVGILSERDISHGMAERGAKLAALSASDLMTRDVASCTPEDSIKQVMDTMSRLHIRHLPVLKGGVLVSVIGQRDVLNAFLQEAQLEVNVLRDYARART